MDTSSKASDVTSALSQIPTGLDSTSPYLAPPLPSSTPEPQPDVEQSAGALNISNGSSSKKKKKKAAGAISGSQPGLALSSSPANIDVDAEARVVKEVSSVRPAQLHVAGDGDATRGMELDRLGEGGLDEVQGEMTSRLLGFDGLIIEEDVATGAITAATVYGT